MRANELTVTGVPSPSVSIYWPTAVVTMVSSVVQLDSLELQQVLALGKPVMVSAS